VKKDKRFFHLAESAFNEANRIYVIGKQIKNRVTDLFPAVPQIASKMVELNLGVNTSLFNPVTKKSRKDSISQLCTLLKDVKRGKTKKQSQTMHDMIKNDMSLKKLLTL
jgi:hypothetical protein